MTKFWSEEKPVEAENDLFRVKVVGSIPAGPTILPLITFEIKNREKYR